MKKLLGILGSFGLLASSTSTVVACPKVEPGEIKDGITPKDVKYLENESFNVETLNGDDYSGLKAVDETNSLELKTERSSSNHKLWTVSYTAKKVPADGEKISVKLTYESAEKK
ncbi:lipoprotein [Spiroplasma gladiatoris]|nr:lipoprotein [Spiroplasma gladiatoris]